MGLVMDGDLCCLCLCVTWSRGAGLGGGGVEAEGMGEGLGGGGMRKLCCFQSTPLLPRGGDMLCRSFSISPR